MAANPCPCGNLGIKGKTCLCSMQELLRYRRKLGGPLLDRVDIRVPVEPVSPAALIGAEGESSSSIRSRVEAAIRLQTERYGQGSGLNARLSPGSIEKHCRLKPEAARAFQSEVYRLALSSRACHSILKVARTIADLSESDAIEETQLREAIGLRRFGDGDEIWPC
jgi:magnesium chelatase family protein